MKLGTKVAELMVNALNVTVLIVTVLIVTVLILTDRNDLICSFPGYFPL